MPKTAKKSARKAAKKSPPRVKVPAGLSARPTPQRDRVEAECERLLSGGKAIQDIAPNTVAHKLQIDTGVCARLVKQWKASRSTAGAVLRMVPLKELTVLKQFQLRPGQVAEAVEDYRVRREEGSDPPAIDVFEIEGEGLVVVHGFHRFDAATLARAGEVSCAVRKGTVDDALEFAALSNVHNGVERCPRTKRNQVRTLLGLPKWRDRTDQEVAIAAQVSRSRVQHWRSELDRERLDSAEAKKLEAMPPSDTNGSAEGEGIDVSFDFKGTRGTHLRGKPSKGGASSGNGHVPESSAGSPKASADRYAPTPAEMRDIERTELYKLLPADKKEGYAQEVAYYLRVREQLDALVKAHATARRPASQGKVLPILQMKIHALVESSDPRKYRTCMTCKGKGGACCKGRGYDQN